MIEGFRFALNRSKLQKSRRRTIMAYDQEIKAAKDQKAPDDIIVKLKYDAFFETDCIDDDIAALQSSFLIQKAQKLLIPIPPMTRENDGYKFWDESRFTGRIHLNALAAADLRASLRKERKERKEAWLPLLSMLIALGGLTVAAISLLKTQ